MVKEFNRSLKRDQILFVLALLVFGAMAFSNVIWQNPIDPALAILVGGLLGLPIVSSAERKDK
jgi:hypothetical protein